MPGCGPISYPAGHLVTEGAHLGFGVPGVGGEAQFAHGRAHGVRPVADGDRF